MSYFKNSEPEYPPVSGQRREPDLSAFCVKALWEKAFGSTRPPARDLGSQAADGESRSTPGSCCRTLGVSLHTLEVSARGAVLVSGGVALAAWAGTGGGRHRSPSLGNARRARRWAFRLRRIRAPVISRN